ncbi:MAG: tetratricopeptide repeat protein [Azoarcus sp.]|nr:tetratricopeptide repeat protein [Azoarcus sp.]
MEVEDSGIERVKKPARRPWGKEVLARMRKLLPTPSPQPVFFEVRNVSAKPRLFREFRFSEGLTRYVMAESLWQDFEAFYQSKQPFSWWLITGRAGSGKSRLALEFCQALETGYAGFLLAGGKEPVGVAPVEGEDFSYWKVGFVNLAKTPFSTWEAWRPGEHTLLVFDRTARNYNSGIFSGPPLEEDGGVPRRFQLGAILKLLAQKAVMGQYGTYRVRVLLLEREAMRPDESGQAQDWYGDLPTFAAQRFRELPTPMPAVPPKNLFGIAQDIWKKTGKAAASCVTSEAFLEKLKSIDPHCTPLFAMLLATAVADGHEIGTLNRGAVLNCAFLSEFGPAGRFSSMTSPPSVIRALAISTLTGGHLGVCELGENHVLWNSGLGRSDPPWRFRPWPIEPNLLGEYSILSDVYREIVPKDVRIGDDEMRTLISSAWEACSPEVADFFNRCGQDFYDLSGWVEKVFLNARLAEIDGERYAQTAVNILSRLGKEQLETARLMVKHLNGLARSGMFCLERAKCTVHLISILCEAGILDEASLELLGMRVLGDSEEIQSCRAVASSRLIEAFCKAGELVRARVLYEGALSIWQPKENWMPRARALAGLINIYAKEGDFGEARELFAHLDFCGDSETVRALRTKLAVNLIALFGKAGRLEDAQAIFRCLQTLKDSPDTREAMAKASRFISFFSAAQQGGENRKAG